MSSLPSIGGPTMAVGQLNKVRLSTVAISSTPGASAVSRVSRDRYHSNMHSSCREEIVERFDAFRDAVSGLLELSFDVLTCPELLGMLQRLEQDTRRLPVLGHALINQLARQASETKWAAS